MARSMVLRLVSLVLLASATAKAVSLLVTEPSESLPPALTAGLALGELGIAGWLLSGFRPVAACWLAWVCFSGFLGVAIGKFIAGDASCDCFGGLTIHPLVSAALDAAVLAAIALHTNCLPTPRAARTAFAMLGVAALMSTGGAVWSAAHRQSSFAGAGDSGGLGAADAIVDMNYGEWAGRRFPLLSRIHTGARLDIGTWIVMLYNWNCSTCRASLPQYVNLDNELAHDRQAG